MSRNSFYWGVFVTVYGPFPHRCYFCGEQVDGYLRPFDSTAAIIHHLDEDKTNNDSSNLVPAHHGCHVAHHHRGKRRSPEARANMYAGNKGLTHTPEARAKMSKAAKGRPKSPETRANMSKAQKGHPGWFRGKQHTAETLEKMRRAHTGHKRQTEEVRLKISRAQTGRVYPRACCVNCRREVAMNHIARHRCP